MNALRSIVFVLWLYGSMTVIGLSFMPLAVFSEAAAIQAARTWASALIWGVRAICGIRLEVRGREHIPRGAALVAAKHQSMMDTIIPFALLEGPSVVLKRELLKLPIFGWFAKRAGMIVVNREAHAAALRTMLRDGRDRAAKGRQIFIFPEGTRQAPGAPPDYKPGIAALYRDLKLPCTPVALNIGQFWPAHGLVRKPGLAVIEFLPVIAPGLPRDEFMRELEARIETASSALLEKPQ
jgi:1-acyl-sn-glycerol-3-phosphate acyltransferase